MKRKTFLFNNILIGILFLSSNILAQFSFTSSDSATCSSIISFAETDSLSQKSTEQILTQIAQQFIGTNYAAHTIETPGKELIKINLQNFDCYTFVEASLALSIIVKKGNPNFKSFLREVENIRYRNGKLKGWASRLHYFSDWIYDLSGRKIIKDITQELGGKPYDKKINFMSKHTNAYPALSNNPLLVDSIIQIENSINSRRFFYIPQDSIEKIENRIHSGDIIGITTDIPGLDISHTGIALKRDDGRVYFLHAPNIGKKVQISNLPLAQYILSHKHQTGIMIARVLSPTK